MYANSTSGWLVEGYFNEPFDAKFNAGDGR